MPTRVEVINQIYQAVNARRIADIEPLIGFYRLRNGLTWYFNRITSVEPDVQFVVGDFNEVGDVVSYRVTLTGTRLPHQPATQSMRFKRNEPIDFRNVFNVLDTPNATAFGGFHVRAPLLTELFDKITAIPGFFTIDDCAHFSLILETQRALGFEGDVFEIGSYYGRSTAAIAWSMRPEETLVVCDLFELDGSDVDYGGLRGLGPPTPEILRQNIANVKPGDSSPKLEVHRCLSSDVPLEAKPRFRFVHIDGGHDEAVALGDLRFCAERMLVGGVMVVDDYAHIFYPGVTAAVDRFLSERPDFHVMVDVNRITETGRKIYLARRRPGQSV